MYLCEHWEKGAEGASIWQKVLLTSTNAKQVHYAYNIKDSIIKKLNQSLQSFIKQKR